MDLIKKSLVESAKVLSDLMQDEHLLLKIRSAADMMIESLKKGGKIISFGNGGSMTDAMHFAEELTGRYRDDRPAIAAVSISDPSHISCVGNDYGFQYIFSRYIEANGKENDVILAITSSGNSDNIIKACMSAREKRIKIITLTGKTGGRLAGIPDVEIRINHHSYSDRIQEMHILIIHILVELIEKGLFPEVNKS